MTFVKKFQSQMTLFKSVVIVAAFILFSNLLIVANYLPLNEDWWGFWDSIESHEVLYGEMRVPFPPLAIYYSGLLNTLSSEGILTARYYGIGFHVLFSLTTFVALFVYFGRTRISQVLLVTLIIEGLQFFPTSTYIVRDYQQLVIFIVAIFLLTRKLLPKGVGWETLVTWVVFLLALLTKQNIAFAVGIYILLLPLIHGMGRFYFISNFCLTLTVALYLKYILNPLWLSSYFGNESKGGLVIIFSRFFADPANARLFSLALLFSFVTLAFILLRGHGRGYILSQLSSAGPLKAIIARLIAKESSPILSSPTGIGGPSFVSSSFRWAVRSSPSFLLYGIGLSLILCVLGRTELLIIFCLSWLLTGLLLHTLLPKFLIQQSVAKSVGVIDDKGLFIFLALITWAGTFAAGFSLNNIYFVISFALLSLVNLPKFSSLKLVLLMAVMGLWIILFSYERYFKQIYNWWGYHINGVIESKYESSHNLLRGLKFDKFTATVLNNVSDTAHLSTIEGPSKKVMVIPYMPIVYKLMDSVPEYRTPILWFDVSDKRHGKEVADDIGARVPDSIFFFLPKSNVFMAHLDMRRDSSALAIVTQSLVDSLIRGDYKLKSVVYNFEIKSGVTQSKDYVPEAPLRALIVPLEGAVSIRSPSSCVYVPLQQSLEGVIEVFFKNDYCYRSHVEAMGFDISESRPYYIFITAVKSSS